MKEKILVGLILVIFFVYRLFLSPKVFNGDLVSQASWGYYVANNGPLNLYSYDVWIFSWPNHPPLTNLYYGMCFDIFRETSLRLHQSVFLLNKIGFNSGSYFVFVDSFDRLVSPEVPYSLGYMLCLKLFPILADMAIGLIIYKLASSNGGKAIMYLLAYLALPFSWYISSLWGQTDQLAFLFILLAFLLVLRYPFWSIIMLFIGGSLKPTSVFLIPVYLFILYKSKPKYIHVLLAIAICMFLNYFIFSVFSNNNYYNFTFDQLLPRLFDKPLRLTTNSYNFWHIFVLHKNISSDVVLGIFTGKVWSYILLLVVNVVAIINLRRISLRSLIGSLFIVSFGSWLFATEMLDRYAFAGIVSGLIVSIYYPKVFKYWLVLSSVYWINLFRSWWYPSQLYLLRDLLVWNNYAIGFYFSLINLIVYFGIVLIVVREMNCTNVSNKAS